MVNGHSGQPEANRRVSPGGAIRDSVLHETAGK